MARFNDCDRIEIGVFSLLFFNVSIGRFSLTFIRMNVCFLFRFSPSELTHMIARDTYLSRNANVFR